MQLNVDYLSVSINCSENLKEIYIAELSGQGYDGFLETGHGFEAYIPSADFSGEVIEQLREKYGDASLSFELSTIQPRNWNAEWEKGFQPVLIQGRCSIRAPFHPRVEGAEFDIVISPKMSFGTGHHETTALMIRQMLDMDFTGLNVLDLGSGTGILAILASMKGAARVVAVDHEEWAWQNCKENIQLNSCGNIIPLLGEASSMPEEKFDIILANINRNVILESIEFFARSLQRGGLLLVSGFYRQDVEVILQASSEKGFILQTQPENNNWVSLKFIHNLEK
jgi:ribosomal protein L11 methyltransferase